MVDNTLKLRPLRGDERDTIIGFPGIGRPAEYEPKKSTIFDRHYLAHPAKNGELPFAIGTLGDEIVAATGFMAVPIRFKGRSQFAVVEERLILPGDSDDDFLLHDDH